MASEGVDVVVAEANVRYLVPLRFDDLFDVRVTIARLGTTAMTIGIELLRGTDVVTEGWLRHVFVERGTSAKTPIPDSVRAPLQEYLREDAQLQP